MDAADARTPAPPARAGAGASPSAAGGNAALWHGVEQAHMMGVELVVAVVLWGGIGWWVDGRLGTGAWFTVIGALIGNAAGIYLVWLRAQRLDGLDAAPEPAAPTATAEPTPGTTGGRARVR